MLVTKGTQPSLWEAMLPDVCLQMPVELARVDSLLDDERFFAPFREHFDLVWGRPSIPMETYLRPVFLRRRYRLSYETLCREVADSISWQRFCRIGVGGGVPHSTTLMKITKRCGPQTVDQLNEALLARAAEARLVKTGKVRADTTVVEAGVDYPTDSGLLGSGIGTIAKLSRRVQAAGGATRTRVRDRSRSANRRARAITSKLKLRRDEAKQQVKAITGELADLAETAASEADAVARNTRRSLARAGAAASGQLRAAVAELESTLSRVGTIVSQTRTRLSGQRVDGASRLVSARDPDARPIVKGRLGKPVEFGYKTQVLDNADGIVLDYGTHLGNPADAPLLAPAVERVTRRLGRAPRAVTADRNYGEAAVDDELHNLGVSTVAIPRKGRPTAARHQAEHAPSFHKLIKWRTGSEGRISHLKHSYGWDRTRIDGIQGARIWTGHGVLTHNLVKISGLAGQLIDTPACTYGRLSSKATPSSALLGR